MLQMVGRCLRLVPAKTAIIIDHSNNIATLGFPDDDFEWSLTGTLKAGKKAAYDGPPPPANCMECYSQVKRPCPPMCPVCGEPLVFPVELPKFSRGELIEIKRAEAEAARALKAAARTSKLEAEASEGRA